MRLTDRGRVLVGAIVLVVVSGFGFGARGLNAVVVPALVVLATAAYQLYDVGRPEVERELPERGQRGETVRVRLLVDTGSSLPALIHERVGDGLDASGNRWEVPLDRSPLEYDLELERRGERAVGPLSIEVRDVFGLVSRTFRYRERDPAIRGMVRAPMQNRILVRPRVYPLAGPAHAAIMALHGDLGDARDEFDYLRSYRRGDPLKDIHWKSSAKLPDEDFVVKEFTADQDSDAITIGAEGTRATMDAVADAAASVVMNLLESGVDHVLVTPTARIEGDDTESREAVLDHLARVDPGSLDVDTYEGTDVLIRGDEAGVRIEIDGRQYPFRSLIGTTEAPPPTPASGASEA